MSKNNAKSSKTSVRKANFDKIFDKVSKETPKQAVEIEEHKFKSPKIQSIVDKTQLSIASIPERLPKAEVERLEKEFAWSRLVWKPTIYEEKSELDDLTPEQLQILWSQEYIRWLDNPENQPINDKNRKGNLNNYSDKREKQYKKLQKEQKSRKSSLGSIGLNADLADKAVVEKVISYYVDQNLKGILTNKWYALEKVAKMLKSCEWNFETQGETFTFSKGILKSVGQVNAFAMKTMWSSFIDNLNTKFIIDELIDMWYEKPLDKLKKLLERRETENHNYKINYLWLKRMHRKAKLTDKIAEKYSRKLRKSHEKELHNIQNQLQTWKNKFDKDDLQLLTDTFGYEKEIAQFRTDLEWKLMRNVTEWTTFHE